MVICVIQIDINSFETTINRGHPFSFSTPSFQEVKTLEKFYLKNKRRTLKKVHWSHSSKT